MNGVLIFRIFTEILSYPNEYLDLRDLIVALISLVVVFSNIIFGKGLLKILCRWSILLLFSSFSLLLVLRVSLSVMDKKWF
jgi:purine-cytosine permease-like protein